MTKKSITKRWILNTLCVIIVVLLGVVVIAGALFKEQYYESVRLTLDSRATSVVTSYFSLYAESSDDAFNQRAKEFVEDFTDKSIMEVWVIDRNGNVVVSSSGFSVAAEQYPDYEKAKISKTGKATWIGKMNSGESVMTLTYVLPSQPGRPAGAVRYLISLSDINAQLVTIIILLSLLCLVILAFVTVSGMFFIRSIVNPVKKINETAIRIAKGDFNARIEGHEYDDEIGQLCESINNMAREIKETDRLKNEFISTVSHELRTPLTAIKGWGETILETPQKDEALTQQGLGVIIKESERLTQLVEELLDFSRIENGNLTMRMAMIDVLAELDEAVFVFKERSMRDGIELQYNVPEQPAPMSGDANRIKQVFVNILDNSFKYTKAGGTVNISAAFLENKIRITIADTGCGISKNDLPHVTERFYKANTSVRGSGIGLAVVNEIVCRHNGSMTLNSVEGQGTTITVTFPIQPEGQK